MQMNSPANQSPSDRSIDPETTEFTVTNHYYDNTTSGHNVLARTRDDEWVYYTYAQVGAAPAEYSYTVKGAGELDFNAALARTTDEIADTIREAAETDNIDALADRADTVADALVTEYEHAAEEIVAEAAHDEGCATITANGMAAVSHVTEAHQHEAKYAVTELIDTDEYAVRDDDPDHIDADDIEARAIELVRQALREAVPTPRENPHTEYIARIEFDE